MKTITELLQEMKDTYEQEWEIFYQERIHKGSVADYETRGDFFIDTMKLFKEQKASRKNY